VSASDAARPGEVVGAPRLDDALHEAARRLGLRATEAGDLTTLASDVAARDGPVVVVVLDATKATLGEAMAACKALRRLDGRPHGLVVVVGRSDLDELALRDELFDDLVVAPVDVDELTARLRHVAAARGAATGAETVEHGPLTINLETYQATVDGRVLDLTYMEYELLRFFATNPGKVLTRETLLSRVWGYAYYGGARTVDVHVRRLRAKLGEAHAHLIQTVRSVGYRFG
jgi:DNA-binding response OmpR family regulator